jgi:hypothetical protein
MGLLRLLAFPLTGPLWVAKVVRDEAERQLYDEDAIRGQIARLQQQHQAGEISPEDFDREEEALFQRLLDARQYHRQQQLEGQEL